MPSGSSSEDSTKLINQIFRVICDLTNDEAKIVRVQAMKMIVCTQNVSGEYVWENRFI